MGVSAQQVAGVAAPDAEGAIRIECEILPQDVASPHMSYQRLKMSPAARIVSRVALVAVFAFYIVEAGFIDFQMWRLGHTIVWALVWSQAATLVIGSSGWLFVLVLRRVAYPWRRPAYGHRVFTLSGDGFTVQGLQASTHLRWGAIDRFEATPDGLVLFRSLNVGWIIPQRAIDAERAANLKAKITDWREADMAWSSPMATEAEWPPAPAKSVLPPLDPAMPADSDRVEFTQTRAAQTVEFRAASSAAKPMWARIAMPLVGGAAFFLFAKYGGLSVPPPLLIGIAFAGLFAATDWWPASHQKPTDPLDQIRTVSFTAAGATLKTPDVESFYRWPAVTRIVSLRSGVAFVVGWRQIVFAPAAAFADGDAMAAFAERARAAARTSASAATGAAGMVP